MKKLSKLQINPERLMKNEELLLLRGGYEVDPNCQLANCSSDTHCREYSGGCIYCVKHPNKPATMICSQFDD